MRDTVRERCPAKVNLFLEVLGRRPDGYHDIATVMAPVSLYDTLQLAAAKRDALAVTPAEAAPADATNTVLKAVAALRKRKGVPPVRIRLAKRIPSGAGLGGGSSDAAGAVRAANRLFRLGLTPDDERDVLAEIGSDTSFFARPGWAVCTGRGEVVTPIAFGRSYPLVIVAPPYENLTADVYRRYRGGDERRAPDTLLEPLQAGRDIAKRLFNRLEAPAFELRLELAELKCAMSELPFRTVMMTGSGSALFGLCRDARHQKALATACRRRGWGRVFAVRTLAD